MRIIADGQPGGAVTKLIAKFSLALFLAALIAPCGVVPPHEMRDGAAGTMCAGHDGGHASHGPAAITKSAEQCGMDIAAPRTAPEPVLAVRHVPAFDFLFASQGPAAAPPVMVVAKSRAGPDFPRSSAASSTERLLL